MGGCLPLCCPALLRACGNHSGEAERSYGIGLKLFGFIAESVFTFLPGILFEMIPEHRSESSRNRVRLTPGFPTVSWAVRLGPMEVSRSLCDWLMAGRLRGTSLQRRPSYQE